jgi:hypothetical protein
MSTILVVIVAVIIMLMLMTLAILSPLLFATTTSSFASPLEMEYSDRRHNHDADYLLYSSNNSTSSNSRNPHGRHSSQTHQWNVQYPEPFYNPYAHLVASEERRSSSAIPYPEYNYHRVQTA